jgi:hypothetical protein
MKEQTMMLGRREFTLQSILALLGGVIITVADCGGGSSSPTSPTPADSGSEVGTITGNHGHSAVITAAQLTAGNALELHIRGVADHDHTVSLSAAEVMAAANRQRVSKDSSTDAGHDHAVTFN